MVKKDQEKHDAKYTMYTKKVQFKKIYIYIYYNYYYFFIIYSFVWILDFYSTPVQVSDWRYIKLIVLLLCIHIICLNQIFNLF